MCVRLTAGAAAEAAVVVEVSHGLAGLVGSVHGLVTLHTHPWNTTNAHKNVLSQGTTFPSLIQHKPLNW